MRVPRDAAIRVLTRVLNDRVALDQALEEIPPGTAEQRAWLQDVCSGTLRWKGRLDFIIDSIALKKKPSGWLRKLLLISTYQLIAQDRSFAALVVSESVDEAKSKEGIAPSQFVNATLRKIADHAESWRNAPSDSAELASLPGWIWNKLLHQYGAEWAQAFARASLERPTQWVRTHRTDWNASWLKAGPIPHAFEVIEGGKITVKEGFAEGEFYVQDISSQFLIHEISKIVKAGGGVTALDLCAAPGGKSIGLAWNEFQVSASDISEDRMKLLAENVKRLGASISVVPPADLEALHPQDLVWVDAPCSASGIIRRHPEVRWFREERQLTELTKLQSKLLIEGWARVKPGGLLAYSVCSVLKEEGERVVKSFKEGKVEAMWTLAPQIAPHGDGFFAALIRKI